MPFSVGKGSPIDLEYDCAMHRSRPWIIADAVARTRDVAVVRQQVEIFFDFVSTTVVAATRGRQNPQRTGYDDIPLAVVGAPGAASGGEP